MGTIGDTSTDLDCIIRGIAESRVLFLSRETGRPVSWTGQILGAHRIFYIALFVRCQAQCLVARMGLLRVREQARERAGQRRATMAREERSWNEEQSHFASFVRGRGDGSASR